MLPSAIVIIQPAPNPKRHFNKSVHCLEVLLVQNISKIGLDIPTNLFRSFSSSNGPYAMTPGASCLPLHPVARSQPTNRASWPSFLLPCPEQRPLGTLATRWLNILMASTRYLSILMEGDGKHSPCEKEPALQHALRKTEQSYVSERTEQLPVKGATESRVTCRETLSPHELEESRVTPNHQ